MVAPTDRGMAVGSVYWDDDLTPETWWRMEKHGWELEESTVREADAKGRHPMLGPDGDLLWAPHGEVWALYDARGRLLRRADVVTATPDPGAEFGVIIPPMNDSDHESDVDLSDDGPWTDTGTVIDASGAVSDEEA